MEELIYIFSISFQISGAILLLFFSLSTKREKVIKRFINKNIITKNFNGDLDYDIGEFKETYRTAYLNKLSFAFIAIGYLLGIFGKIGDKLYAFVGIIVNTSLLIGIAFGISSLIVKYDKKANKLITYEEINKIGIDLNFEAINKEEIEENFK